MSGCRNLCDVVQRGVRLYADFYHRRQGRRHHLPSQSRNCSDENGKFFLYYRQVKARSHQAKAKIFSDVYVAYPLIFLHCSLIFFAVGPPVLLGVNRPLEPPMWLFFWKGRGIVHIHGSEI